MGSVSIGKTMRTIWSFIRRHGENMRIHLMNLHMFESGKWFLIQTSSHFVGFISKFLRQTHIFSEVDYIFPTNVSQKVKLQRVMLGNQLHHQHLNCHLESNTMRFGCILTPRALRHGGCFINFPTVMQCFVDVYLWRTKTCWPHAVGMKFTSVRPCFTVGCPEEDDDGLWILQVSMSRVGERGKLKGHFDAFWCILMHFDTFWCILQPGFDDVLVASCSCSYISA